MTTDELGEILSEIGELDEVVDADINDYNSWEADIYIVIAKWVENKRAISTKIRAIFKKYGIINNKSMSGWRIEGNTFLADIAYSDLNSPVLEDFDEEVLVFEKDNYSCMSDERLEEIFKKTYRNSGMEIEDHIKVIESRLGGKYDIAPLWKLEHGSIAFELNRSCRWDSSAVGCIAIRKGSDKEFTDVIEELNDALECEDDECCRDAA